MSIHPSYDARKQKGNKQQWQPGGKSAAEREPKRAKERMLMTTVWHNMHGIEEDHNLDSIE